MMTFSNITNKQTLYIDVYKMMTFSNITNNIRKEHTSRNKMKNCQNNYKNHSKNIRNTC